MTGWPMPEKSPSASVAGALPLSKSCADAVPVLRNSAAVARVGWPDKLNIVRSLPAARLNRFKNIQMCRSLSVHSTRTPERRERCDSNNTDCSHEFRRRALADDELDSGFADCR